ncbi:MAG: HDOD domain-containing protein [Burkholderiaceae bacterium]|jgi:HD-like signal output (HDOD) protein|nr:HDOD domain-containing protein [Burkholderiaceae bacterium]
MSVSTQHPILNKLSATRLPTISQVLVKLLSLYQDDCASITELAHLIWQEPTMAQKILSIANSSAYVHTGSHVRLDLRAFWRHSLATAMIAYRFTQTA